MLTDAAEAEDSMMPNKPAKQEEMQNPDDMLHDIPFTAADRESETQQAVQAAEATTEAATCDEEERQTHQMGKLASTSPISFIV